MPHPHRARRVGAGGLALATLVSLASSAQAQPAAASEPSPGTLAARPEPLRRQMEYLRRGLVAVKTDEGVFLSWRLLGTDPASITFNLYRDGVRVNDAPLATSTNYLDRGGDLTSTYEVRPVVDGRELPATERARVWAQPYLEIPLQRPEGGVTPDGVAYTYHANDASVGDLDGDGEYEIVLKWDPSNSKDNAHDGFTGEVLLDAYKLDGTLLWRLRLGKNIRAGAHYT